MSAKLTRKERAELQRQQHKAATSSNEITPLAKKKTATPKIVLKETTLIKRLNLILIILAVGVYCNSLVNDYALDDYGVILENQQTKEGTSAIFKILSSGYRAGTVGGDNALYRPLSKVMFAIEWSLSERNAGLSHFVNVSLFVLSIVLLFRMLRRYMKENIIVPFVAAALFAVHPIHTEVVANIKGRDDILCFLFFVVTALYVHRYTVKHKTKYLIGAGISFMLCMLSKESAITFVAVIPLMLYYFTDSSRETYIRVTGVVAGIAVIFLLMRMAALSGGGISPVPYIDNYIVGIDSFVGQRATAVAIGGLYLVKLIVPYGLVCDASVAQMPVYGLGSWQFLVSLLVFIAAAGFAFMKFKSKHPVSFAIFYFFITFSIVSNIPFLLGTNYGERLMYAPSLAMCIIAAWMLNRFLNAEENSSGTLGDFMKSQQKTVIALGVIVVAYSAVSIMRNPVWHDNETLYGNDMQISDKSCKLRYFYGNHMTQSDSLDILVKGSPEWNHRIDTGIVELRNSIALCPIYSDALQKLADVFVEKQQYDSAEFYYRRAIRVNPTSAIARNNFGSMLFSQQRYFEAQYQFESAIRFNRQYADAYNNLAGCIGTQGAAFVNKGNAYPWKKQELFAKAMDYYQQSVNYSLLAIACDPNYIKGYETTAMTYQNMGNQVEAQKYSAAAQQLKNSGQGH
jgi:Tfp pilus assembly protein PilF